MNMYYIAWHLSILCGMISSVVLICNGVKKFGYFGIVFSLCMYVLGLFTR